MNPLPLLRLANPLVGRLLESRAHRLLSSTLVVLTYRGRRSGREFRIPLQYAELADHRIVALAVRPERKLWWRSFSDPAPALLLVAGATHPVIGRLLAGDERRAAVRAYVERFPRATGPLGLSGEPDDDALDGAPAAVVAFEPA